MKDDDNEKLNLKDIPRYTNIEIHPYKRLNSSNSTDKKLKDEYISKEEEDKRQEELKQKREMSFRARKRIISRIKSEREIKNDSEINNLKDNVPRIEINLNEENQKFKRLNSNNNIGCMSHLKKIYQIMEMKNSKIINVRNSQINNDSTDCKRNTYAENYYIKNNNLNEININENSSNKSQKSNYILYKNVRHIYKKNALKNSVLNEKKIRILKDNKKQEIKNNNKCDNINFTNENINKNLEDIDKKIKDQNNSIKNNNKISHNDINSYNNRKYFYNFDTNGASQKSEFNISLNSRKKLILNLKINLKNTDSNSNNNIINNNILQFKRIKTDKNIENVGLSLYNYLIPKDKKKAYIKNENKYSNLSFIAETHSHKTFINKKSNMINIKVLSKNLKPNSIETEKINIQDKKVINKKEFIIDFFELLIDISNSINDRIQFCNLLYNLNQKFYLINFKEYKDEYKHIFKDNENFEYVFKHFGLILVPLLFFSKDDNLYNSFNIKIQELLIQIIYSSLNYAEMENNNDSNKIYQFTRANTFQSVIAIHRYVLSLINLLFNNKREYIPLKEALEQIHSIIIKKDYKFILKILNESILFCYNSKPKSSYSLSLFKFNNILFNKESKEKKNNLKFSQKNNSFSEKVQSIPFIKTPMKKKFCLVLDIDETLSHTLKLSFGGYFLLRPGAKSFLENVEKLYEIIIFTSSPKYYADKILDKIDINGNIFSHRLYKDHVLYENGKTIKNLNLIGRDLTKTIFIDNLRSNAKYNLDNLCPITTWKSDIFDDRLIKLKDKLVHLATCGKYDDDITQGL